MKSETKTWRKLVVVLGAAGALAIGTAGTAAAADESGGQDNIVNASNTRSNTSVVRTSFRLVFVSGQPVTAQNVAYAYNSCSNCSATAVALEGVVIEGPNSSIAPQNAAVSVNYQCSTCSAMAYAGQVNVQYLSGPVHFTEAGSEQIEAISRGVRALRRPGLSQAYIKATAEALYAQLNTVLNTQLVSDNGDDSHHGNSRQMSSAA
jgi:hypothetical protein